MKRKTRQDKRKKKRMEFKKLETKIMKETGEERK